MIATLAVATLGTSVTTVFLREGPSWLDVPFHSQHYRLRVAREGAIVLSQGHRTTVVGGGEGSDGGTLNWAGDLDHDGKLDLIVLVTREKNAEFCLYLSSAARGKD
ncbi:MAG TPA: hypothetical protein VN725_02695 [Rhodanobacteraceae bacterium]|nr:hypothetical protein [Rhodanobacteraceae bacterium]